jgi:glutathione S-transferase
MSPIQHEWTLLYHGGGKQLKGRGELIRLMFEDKGVEYFYSGENLYGPTGVFDCFRGSVDAIFSEEDSIPNPIFFPPAIWHRPQDGDEVVINQTPACMIYVGDILGYSPSSIKEKAVANAILFNALDYISRGRSSFHPVKDDLSYHSQKEEGDKASLEWTKAKMPIWLAHFEKIVKKSGPESPVAGGPSITYADFALFHALDATVNQFNNEKYEMAWDNQNVPNLKKYYEWMKSRPNLKSYFESDRVARKSPPASHIIKQAPFKFLSHTLTAISTFFCGSLGGR